jgi:streptomycin 6-kinase
VQQALVRNVLDNWGERGAAWLAALPDSIARIAAQWELTVAATYPMTFHWVARVARADGAPAVLKIGVPDEHLAHEAEALRIFGGGGAARLLAEDVPRGALLLECALPGTPVADLVPADDRAATAALIEAGRRLHRVPPSGCSLPHLSGEREDFVAHLRRFPGDEVVGKAAGLFDELCASSPGDVVLHADLHHGNVLRAGDRWIAIDPHGRVGDPGYDCAAMLYNPGPDRRDDDLLRLVPARVEQLADGFGLPVERVRAWGFVMAVLSQVWGPGGGRAADVADLLGRRS